MKWGVLDNDRIIMNLIAVEDDATAQAMGAVKIIGKYRIGDRYPTLEEQVQQLMEKGLENTGQTTALEEELAALKAAVVRGAGL